MIPLGARAATARPSDRSAPPGDAGEGRFCVVPYKKWPVVRVDFDRWPLHARIGWDRVRRVYEKREDSPEDRLELLSCGSNRLEGLIGVGRYLIRGASVRPGLMGTAGKVSQIWIGSASLRPVDMAGPPAAVAGWSHDPNAVVVDLTGGL